MKTNKLWSIIVMLILVLGTVISFASCSSDDEDGDNSSSSIIGTWYYTTNESFTEDGVSYKYSSYIERTFQKDGIVIQYDKVTEIIDGIAEDSESTEYNSWKTDGKTLYIGCGWSNKNEVKAIDIKDDSTWETKQEYSISGNKLTITYRGRSVTLTRK